MQIYYVAIYNNKCFPAKRIAIQLMETWSLLYCWESFNQSIDFISSHAKAVINVTSLINNIISDEESTKAYMLIGCRPLNMATIKIL